LNLRSCFTRALSSKSFASLLNLQKSPKLLGVLGLGLFSSLTAGSALATHSRHTLHPVRRHTARPTFVAQTPSASSDQLAQTFSTLNTGTSSLAAVAAGATQADSAARYELKLHHLHTGEDIDIVYRIGNQYIPSAIAKLNYFLRDHRTQDVSHYDVREFDLLHTLLASLGRPNDVIDIVCGYRTPWSNNFLRTRAAVTGVAKNSQHVQAKAIDIRIPGVSTSHLRDVALSLHEGGVGYYPVSQFVHVDVGPVRQWSFGGRGE
jgi:uncharacterized protein YcbK (DUF882 family)